MRFSQVLRSSTQRITRRKSFTTIALKRDLKYIAERRKGTLSGNPLAMAAGMAVIGHLKENDPYQELEVVAARWAKGMKDAADACGIPLQTTYCGSMIGFNFSKTPVHSFEDAAACDIESFNRFFHLMLEEGVYLAPSAFEAGFLSVCHSEGLIERTLESARRCFAEVARG